MAGKSNMQNTGSRLAAPIYAERRMRIICIGAGASGICLAYKVQRSFSNFELTVYEKNAGVSGTWYENRYPGCACDVPGHNYTYSFDPKPDWTAVYAGSKEINSYFEGFVERHDLAKYCHLQHQVVGAAWNTSKSCWVIEVRDLARDLIFTAECDILINASGILNAWKWPDIPGLETFEGSLVHSAAWDSTIDLSNRVVGLIGNGSSGIQILPEVQPIAKKLITFIREATWISPMPGMEQHVFTDDEVKLFCSDKAHHLQYRRENESRMNSAFGFLKDRHSKIQQDTRAAMTELMKARLNSVEHEARLIPQWAVGCRRLTPGTNYLETLTKPNVEIVYGGIKSITPTGVISNDGAAHNVDVLICATGFDTSFRPRFSIVGSDGQDLRDVWAEESKGYMGLAVGNMPNYFQYLGPNCPIGNGPVLAAVEWQTEYMLHWLDRWQTENIRTFSPKLEAIDDFTAFTDAFMEPTVWKENCRSWYKGHSVTGRVSALWPGSSVHYLEAVQQVREDDWDVVYEGNRFMWLGNGFSRAEADAEGDRAWYIRAEDDSAYRSRDKRRRMKTGSHTGPMLPLEDVEGMKADDVKFDAGIVGGKEARL